MLRVLAELTDEEIEGFISFYSTIFFGLVIGTFVLAVLLFAAFFLKRVVKKTVDLFPIDSPQQLTDNEAEYFASVRFDKKNNAIVVSQSQDFKKCVVSVITKKNESRSFKRLVLKFDNDRRCGIKLKKPFDEYVVVLESVDGKVLKHPSIDNGMMFAVIYSLIVTVVFIATLVVYVMLCSYSLLDAWDSYVIYYAFAGLALLHPLVVIGSYAAIEYLSKKGVF